MCSLALSQTLEMLITSTWSWSNTCHIVIVQRQFLAERRAIEDSLVFYFHFGGGHFRFYHTCLRNINKTLSTIGKIRKDKELKSA